MNKENKITQIREHFFSINLSKIDFYNSFYEMYGFQRPDSLRKFMVNNNISSKDRSSQEQNKIIPPVVVNYNLETLDNFGIEASIGKEYVSAKLPGNLKILITLPLKYKIDFKSKDPHFIQKPILKNIFLKYYSSDLIFPKKGFPGYPNQLRKIKGISKYPLINKFLGVMLSSKKDELYYDKNRHQRDLEWKKINTEIFLNQFI